MGKFLALLDCSFPICTDGLFMLYEFNEIMYLKPSELEGMFPRGMGNSQEMPSIFLLPSLFLLLPLNLGTHRPHPLTSLLTVLVILHVPVLAFALGGVGPYCHPFICSLNKFSAELPTAHTGDSSQSALPGQPHWIHHSCFAARFPFLYLCD